jgi:Zn-finger nucleic acid-binding protein
MSEAYRESLARCPVCKIDMERRSAQDAEVDVCRECRGLWIDWFDGDTWMVANDALPLSMRDPLPLPAHAPCPRCTAVLFSARHEKTGPVVLRCPECFGTFVPRAALDDLVAFSPKSERPEPARLRFVERLKKLLGLGPGQNT